MTVKQPSSIERKQLVSKMKADGNLMYRKANHLYDTATYMKIECLGKSLPAHELKKIERERQTIRRKGDKFWVEGDELWTNARKIDKEISNGKRV